MVRLKLLRTKGDSMWVKDDDEIAAKIKGTKLLVQGSQYDPDKGETFKQMMQEFGKLFTDPQKDFEKHVRLAESSRDQVSLELKKNRDQAVKDMNARIKEAEDLQEKISKEVQDSLDQTTLKQQLSTLRTKYSTFAENKLEEMPELSKEKVKQSLSTLVKELCKTVEAIEQKPLPANIEDIIKEKCQTLHLPGIDWGSVEISCTQEQASNQEDLHYESQAHQDKVQKMGYGVSRSSAFKGKLAGACVAFGASFSTESELQARVEADLEEAKKQETSEVATSHRMSKQLYSFSIKKVFLEESVVNDLASIARKDDLKTQEEECVKFLQKNQELVLYGLFKGPYGLGGFVEISAATTSTKRGNKNELLKISQMHSKTSASAGASGLTSSFVGSASFAAATDQSTQTGQGLHWEQMFGSVSSSLSLKCNGPTVTDLKDMHNVMAADPHAMVIIPYKGSNDRPASSRNVLTLSDLVRFVSDNPDTSQHLVDDLQKGLELLDVFIKNGPSSFAPKPTLPPSARMRSVILFGITGHGKSLCGSVMLGLEPPPAKPAFKSGGLPESTTQGLSFLSSNETMVTVYDTIGLNDTMTWTGEGKNLGNNKKALENLIEAQEMLGAGGLDALLIVFKFGEKFDNVITNSMIDCYQAIFQQSAQRHAHTFIVFTKCSDKYLTNKQEQKTWLNSAVQNSEKFKQLYTVLVNSNPSHVLFVNIHNYQEMDRTDIDALRRAVMANFLACQTLLDVVHNISEPPFQARVGDESRLRMLGKISDEKKQLEPKELKELRDQLKQKEQQLGDR